MVDVTVRRDGVRLRASSPEDLIVEMTRRRGDLKQIVDAQKDPSSSLKVEECFDGIWSKSLRKAVSKHRATGIEIGELWVMLPPNWECPCCKRPKEEILTISDGVLLAKAVEHHDHFVSRISQSFREILGEKWGRNIVGAIDLQNKISEGFTFEKVVICESCNWADGYAKEIVVDALRLEKGALKDFSFEISEIRSFIQSGPNAKHQVIPRKVVTLFEQKRKLEVLEFRRKAVRDEVDLFSRGLHWRSSEHHPSGDEIFIFAQDNASEIGITFTGNFDLVEFSATSKAGEAPPNLWRRNRGRGRRFKTPMRAQAEQFIETKAELRERGPTWKCICCGRPLRLIVRYNNKNGLTAEIGRLGSYKDPVEVCMDCVDVARGLAKEAEASKESITIADINLVILPVSHAKHGLLSELDADRAIEKIRRRETAPVQEKDPFEGPGFFSVF